MTQALSVSDRIDTARERTVDWRLVLLLVLAVAALVRLANLSAPSLTHGEASRALESWFAPLHRMRWYPPAYYALLWITRHALGDSDLALRLPGALAGMACVACVFLFTRRYVDAWSGVCAAAIAAGHTELVSYSRVLKEFSIEALMVVVVAWAGVEACRQFTPGRLRTFLGWAVIAQCVTYTGSICATAWVIVLFGSALSRRYQRRVNVIRVLLIAGCVAAVGALCYVWLSGASNRAATVSSYGALQGAWPADYRPDTLALWVMIQSYGAAQYVLGMASLYPPIDVLVGGYSLLLIGAGVGTLMRRTPVFCLAFATILLLTIVAGAMRIWPYGKYHMMLFLVPLACVAMGCGLKAVASRPGMGVVAFMLAVVCVAVPWARAVNHTVVHPTETEHLRPVMSYIERNARSGDGIFAYYAAGWAARHYWSRDDIPILHQPTDDRDQPDRFADRFAEFAAEHKRVWFVFAHNWKRERDEWVGYLKRHYRLVDEFEIADALTCAFEVKGEGP